MNELKRLFENWLENSIDSADEKEALEKINVFIVDKLSEEEQDELKSKIFQYAIVCQKASFIGGFQKASSLWQESTLWKLDTEKHLHTLQIMKQTETIKILQNIHIDSKFELTSDIIEEIYRYSIDSLALIRNSFLYGYHQGQRAKSEIMKEYLNLL